MKLLRGTAILLVAPVLLLAGLVTWAYQGRFETYAAVCVAAGLIGLLVFLVINFKGLSRAISLREVKYGGNTALLVVMVVAILVLIQVIAIRENPKADLTENKRWSLSPQTRKVLQHLDRDVQVYAFMPKSHQDRGRVEDTLGQYRSYARERFSYEFVDPDRQPMLAQEMGFQSYGDIFFQAGEQKRRSNGPDEKALTNALVQVTREGKKKLYWLTGHGELALSEMSARSGQQAQEALTTEGYEVTKLELVHQESVPEDADMVIIAGPENNPFEGELDKIKTYLDYGGRLLVLLDPRKATAFHPWLERYGVAVGEQYVLDFNPATQRHGYGPEVPIIYQFEHHDITRELMGRAVAFVAACPVEKTEPVPPGKIVSELLKTSSGSFALADISAIQEGGMLRIDEATDRQGPITVGVAGQFDGPIPTDGEDPAKSRFVVFGDSDFVSDRNLGLGDNQNLFLNAVAWLAAEEDTIAIRPRDKAGSPVLLTSQQRSLLFYLPIVVWPSLVILAGFSVYLSRRKLQ
jgi:ABC-type uncharacterized transport system involved in gliding motility auxiliary subunit